MCSSDSRPKRTTCPEPAEAEEAEEALASEEAVRPEDRRDREEANSSLRQMKRNSPPYERDLFKSTFE